MEPMLLIFVITLLTHANALLDCDKHGVFFKPVREGSLKHFAADMRHCEYHIINCLILEFQNSIPYDTRRITAVQGLLSKWWKLARDIKKKQRRDPVVDCTKPGLRQMVQKTLRLNLFRCESVVIKQFLHEMIFAAPRSANRLVFEAFDERWRKIADGVQL